MSNQNERRLLQKCLLLNNHLLWLLNNGLILLRADPEIVTIVFKVDIPYCDFGICSTGSCVTFAEVFS